MRFHRFKVITFLILLSGIIFDETYAYETHAFAARYPGTLQAPLLDFYIEHRFYKSITDDPYKTVFGFNGGLVADIGLRYVIWTRLQSSLSYNFLDRNVSLGLEYSHPLLNDLLQVDGGFYVYNYGIDTRSTATFSHIALSAGPFLKRITPVVNAGFDSEDKYFGIALGLNTTVSDLWDIACEYFPVVQRTSDNKTAKNAFAFGAILKTHSHHFAFFLSNSNNPGMRNNMKGAEFNSLHFCFRINRLFHFGN